MCESEMPFPAERWLLSCNLISFLESTSTNDLQAGLTDLQVSRNINLIRVFLSASYYCNMVEKPCRE